MKPASSSFRKITRIIPSLTVLAVVSLMLAGCEKDYHYIEPALSPDTEISFNNDIQPIFTASCITSGCHDGNNYDPDLRSGFAYSALFSMGNIDTTNDANSILYQRITLPSTDSDFMPQGGSPLPSSDIAKILKWIQDGAKNN